MLADRRIAIYCKSTFFSAINFRVFVFKGIFAAIYFRRLKNRAMQEQCTICLYGHICGDLFSRILLSRENREN